MSTLLFGVLFVIFEEFLIHLEIHDIAYHFAGKLINEL